MSTVEKSIRLYAWKTNYHVFDIVQDEVESRHFNIQLMEATAPVNLSNCRVYFHAEKPDGKTVYIECPITDVSDGRIRVTLTHQIGVLDGTVNCFVQVVSEAGTDLRFDGMQLNVKECNLTESAESSSEFPALVKALSEVVPATERANAATKAANEATDKANTATTNASKATTAANTATANANVATKNANTATTNAVNATNSATEATAAARNATAWANDAAKEAENAFDAVMTSATQLVTEELAKRGQLKPEFANDEKFLKENGDPTKVYVLPDGYVYAWAASEIPSYDNKALPNRDDWLPDCRTDSQGLGKACEGATTTNYIEIPPKAGTVIRVKGLDITTVLENYNDTPPKQGLYDESRVFIDAYHVVSLKDHQTAGHLTYSVSGDVTTITMSIATAYYIRLCGTIMPGYTKDTVAITVNEELNTTVGYSWINTRLRFITAENLNGKVHVDGNIQFAENSNACTDKEQIYVLPDGYIYAYVRKLEWIKPEHNNLAQPSSADWLTDKRLSTSSTSNSTGCYVTNYIRCAVGDTIYIKGLNVTDKADSRGRIHFFDSSKTKLGADTNFLWQLPEPYVVQDPETGVYAIKAGYYVDANSNVKQITGGLTYMRFCGPLISGYTLDDVVITVNELIVEEELVETYSMQNTGIKFVPSDYSGDILDIREALQQHEVRMKLLEQKETSSGEEVPDYWLEHLSGKADEIQVAMETAGRNKSAFMWYTDAHWPNSSKSSPMLLKFMIDNTPMNKVNFGGDIVGDPNPYNHANVDYVHNWRKLISGIPNHHSVYGNHDLNHRSTDVSTIAYALVLAHEESPDMVVGGDSYYYIDNPSEKTRYLYLSYFTNQTAEMKAQATFIAEALSSTPSGWHIVCIAHRWWQYTRDTSTGNIVIAGGSVPAYEAEILKVFDAYNSRASYSASTHFASQNFGGAGGKVEFCIGGHTHIDYDFTSTGGIPIVITASDTNQERSSVEDEDSGVKGTTTESAVFGIVANYTTKQLHVIAIGRGTQRTVTLK